MRIAWGVLLTKAEEIGELKRSGETLKRALETTQLGNQRIGGFGVDPSQLKGEGVWLTPRSKGAAENAISISEQLAGDAWSAQWANGDPKRRVKTAGSQGTARSGGLSPTSPTSGSQKPAASEAGSVTQRSVRSLAPGEDSVVVSELEPINEWERAVGYGEHDEEDFARIWRKPLEAVLGRSFQAPPRPPVRRYRDPEA
jgi:hypothetical protein